MAKQLAFYFNASACIGCKTCQIACKDKNDLPVGIMWRRVVAYEGGNWIETSGTHAPNGVFAYNVSTSCQHCQDPQCVKVCPTGAMHKDENGIVSVNADVCVGCRYCEWACPYGAPQFSEAKGVMTKCDFCKDQIAEGLSPECVRSCPMDALQFGELEELRAKYGDVAAIEPLPTADITHPSLVITLHPKAQISGEGTGRIANLLEEL